MYKSGVYNNGLNCKFGALDHAVLIVGVTKYAGQEVWIIKNSWGPNWGMNGYILFKKGEEMCQMLKSKVIVLSMKGEPVTNPPTAS